MMSSAGLLRCEAIAWVDEDWPGWVRVRLVDAHGRIWFFVDKVPIFFVDEDILPGTSLPRPAFVRCYVVGQPEDQILVVSTTLDHVEAEAGTTHFRVRPNQIERASRPDQLELSAWESGWVAAPGRGAGWSRNHGQHGQALRWTSAGRR